MTTGVIRHDGVFDAVLAQLPCREPGTLIQGTCFVNPDMHVDPFIKRRIDGRGGRAVFNAGQPAGIAMGKDMNGVSLFLLADGPY